MTQIHLEAPQDQDQAGAEDSNTGRFAYMCWKSYKLVPDTKSIDSENLVQADSKLFEPSYLYTHERTNKAVAYSPSLSANVNGTELKPLLGLCGCWLWCNWYANDFLSRLINVFCISAQSLTFSEQSDELIASRLLITVTVLYTGPVLNRKCHVTGGLIPEAFVTIICGE